jgi:hypothetical protein
MYCIALHYIYKTTSVCLPASLPARLSAHLFQLLYQDDIRYDYSMTLCRTGYLPTDLQLQNLPKLNNNYIRVFFMM